MSTKTRATIEDLYKPDVSKRYKVSAPEKLVIFRLFPGLQQSIQATLG